jgi:hypothetical protein
MAERTRNVTVDELAAAVANTSRRAHSGAVIALTAVLDNRLELVLKKALVPMSKRLHEKTAQYIRGEDHNCVRSGGHIIGYV